MEDIIEMSREEFMNIIHMDNREKFIKIMDQRAEVFFDMCKNDEAIKILKERDRILSDGPFRINKIDGDIGYLMCYEDVTTEDDPIKPHMRICIQKVKLT